MAYNNKNKPPLTWTFSPQPMDMDGTPTLTCSPSIQSNEPEISDGVVFSGFEDDPSTSSWDSDTSSETASLPDSSKYEMSFLGKKIAEERLRKKVIAEDELKLLEKKIADLRLRRKVIEEEIMKERAIVEKNLRAAVTQRLSNLRKPEPMIKLFLHLIDELKKHESKHIRIEMVMKGIAKAHIDLVPHYSFQYINNQTLVNAALRDVERFFQLGYKSLCDKMDHMARNEQNKVRIENVRKREKMREEELREREREKSEKKKSMEGKNILQKFGTYVSDLWYWYGHKENW